MTPEELENIAREMLDLIPARNSMHVTYAALIRRRPELIPDVTDLALIDPFAYKVSSFMAGQYVKENEQMPDDLRKFASNVLQGVVVVPKAKGGGISPLQNLWRNLMIQAAIRLLVKKGGMNATRNDESRTTSACDIVANLINLSFDTVKGIYEADLSSKMRNSSVG